MHTIKLSKKNNHFKAIDKKEKEDNGCEENVAKVKHSIAASA